ncbi:LPXTG cell wall anchor domain-containing protein, partial [Micromonospora echinofusca]
AVATDPTPAASPTRAGQTATPTGSTCVSTADARYKHKFDGRAGTASIELLNGPLCAGQEQPLALVSYVAPSAKFALPQYLFDTSVKSFGAPKEGELAVTRLEFAVEVPACFTQVDFVFGDKLIDPLTDSGDRYGDRKVGSPKGIGAQSKGRQAWYNGGQESCVAAPEVEVLSDCDGSVTLKLINRKGNAAATFVVAGSEGFSRTVTVPIKGIEEVELDARSAKEITVTADGKEVYQGRWTKPQDCQEPEVGKPETGHTSTCTELTFTITNPANGISLTSTFTPSTGKAQTVTIEPGRTAKVTFPGEAGLTVTVTGDLASEKPVAWEKPANCAGGGGAGGGDGDLPLTGAAAGGIAAAAGVLLVVGGVLYLMARRRRVRFTA